MAFQQRRLDIPTREAQCVRKHGSAPSCARMAELELARSASDRRLYEIAGVGTLRFAGLFSRRATAEAAATAWSFDRRGVWQTTIEASDAKGTVVGSFAPRKLRRGGLLRWGDRDLELRPAILWREPPRWLRRPDRSTIGVPSSRARMLEEEEHGG
jgi:hypothetical protein